MIFHFLTLLAGLAFLVGVPLTVVLILVRARATPRADQLQYLDPARELADADQLFAYGRISEAEHRALRNKILGISSPELR